VAKKEIPIVEELSDDGFRNPARGQPFYVRSMVLTGILFLLVLYSLKVASTFLIPVVLALLFNFLFSSVIRGLARFRVPPPLGAALVLLALVGGLGMGIYQLALPIGDWVTKFPATLRQVEHKVQSLKQSVQEVSKVTEGVDRLTNLSDGAKKQEVEIKKSTMGENLRAPTQEVVVGAGIMVLLLFFLLASGDLFLRKLVNILPNFHDKKLAVEISREIRKQYFQVSRDHHSHQYLLRCSGGHLYVPARFAESTVVGGHGWSIAFHPFPGIADRNQHCDDGCGGNAR